jgi:succinate dehydrogenase hydrophobic anchor subunit
LAIVIAAYPTFRFKKHNYFKFTHRFSGWLVILLFWSFFLLFAEKTRSRHSLGDFLATQTTLWILVFLTLSIIHPWLYPRKVDAVPEYISPHAIRLHFNFTNIRFGQGFAVLKHPLRDWHGFAQFPVLDGRGFSCLVSTAGDWTADSIQRPPTYLWKRSILVFGFGYCMRMFRSFIVVTTGSGIGPCFSFLAFERRPPMRIIW